MFIPITRGKDGGGGSTPPGERAAGGWSAAMARTQTASKNKMGTRDFMFKKQACQTGANAASLGLTVGQALARVPCEG